jgi:hypothetical protein
MNTNTHRFQGELATRALQQFELLQAISHPSSGRPFLDCVAADKLVMQKLLEDAFRSHPVKLS